LHDDESATDHPAGCRRDHRLVQIDAITRKSVPHMSGKILHVGTDRKIIVFGRGKHGYAVVAIPEFDPRLAQLFAERVVERIVL
jgi:hypothetical protein